MGKKVISGMACKWLYPHCTFARSYVLRMLETILVCQEPGTMQEKKVEVNINNRYNIANKFVRCNER